MKNTVLLVVDVQNALIAKQPYRGQELLENIGVLTGACRESGIEVVYVRHDGSARGMLVRGRRSGRSFPQSPRFPASGFSTSVSAAPFRRPDWRNT